jgi:hypothetical protein
MSSIRNRPHQSRPAPDARIGVALLARAASIVRRASIRFFSRAPLRRSRLLIALAIGLGVWLLPISAAAADTPTSLGNIPLGVYWSGNAGYGSTAPSVSLTPDGEIWGIVHLQGAARQVTPPSCG